ncbi:MAG: tetratricopeptide repeat protein [Syntrophobacteraceae bacterium]
MNCFRKALETGTRLLEANPESAQAARDVSISLERLGDFHHKRGKPGDSGEALNYFRKALEISERLLESNPDSAQAARDVSITFERLGTLHHKRGKPGDAEEALNCFRKALEIRERLLEANPDSAQTARELIVSYRKTSDALRMNGRRLEAFTMRRKAMNLTMEMKDRGFQFDGEFEESNSKLMRKGMFIVGAASLPVLALLIWGILKLFHWLF